MQGAVDGKMSKNTFVTKFVPNFYHFFLPRSLEPCVGGLLTAAIQGPGVPTFPRGVSLLRQIPRYAYDQN